jgi:hypothetical protein
MGGFLRLRVGGELLVGEVCERVVSNNYRTHAKLSCQNTPLAKHLINAPVQV